MAEILADINSDGVQNGICKRANFDRGAMFRILFKDGNLNNYQDLRGRRQKENNAASLRRRMNEIDSEVKEDLSSWN